MNKSDIKLIIGIIIISILFLSIRLLTNNNGDKKALVYYENKLIKTIDLSLDANKYYTVKGYNGDVIIESKKGSIRVKQEKSPLHICSKQGWVSSTSSVIVCLPNKIIIKIEAKDKNLDAVIR